MTTTTPDRIRPRAVSSNVSDMPFMESITSTSELPTVAGPRARDGRSKLHRIVHEYRMVEFAIAIVMYGLALFFATIQVAQRTSSMRVWTLA